MERIIDYATFLEVRRESSERRYRGRTTMQSLSLMLLTCVGVAITTAGCSKSIHVPTPVRNSTDDNTYLDLEAGWKLQVVVPLLKSGTFIAAGHIENARDGTIEFSSEDVIGYTVSHYTIAGKGNGGGVRLQFAEAEISRNGTTVRTLNRPLLPFELPKGTEHIRLVYLTRLSHADHNTAIVASKKLDALNAFTKRLQENPSVCRHGNEIFCSWVPAGIGVRADKA